MTRVQALLFVVLLSFAASLARAASTATPQELESAIQQLDDEKFPIREKAMLYLWEQGQAAESLMRKALETGSPEARMRAKRILQAYDMGIRPDTPKETLELIYKFRDGNINEQREAAKILSEKGELRLLRRLVRTLANEAVRRELDGLISANIKNALGPMIEKGQIQEALALLQEMAIDDQSLRDLAAFAWVSGDLEKLAREAESTLPEEAEGWKTRAWFLRAQGKTAEAAQLAEQHQDGKWALAAKSADGEAIALCRVMLEEPNQHEGAALGINLTLARLENKPENFQQTLHALLQWVQKEPDPVDRRHAVEALILNDRVEDALPFINASFGQPVFDLQFYRGNFDAAFASLGLEKKLPPYSPWAEQLIEKVKLNDQAAFSTLLSFATYIADTGEEAEGMRLLSLLAEACQQNADWFLQIIDAEARLGLGELVAKHIVQGQKLQLDLPNLLSKILGQNEAGKAWWDFIQNRRHEWTQEQGLDALWQITRAGKNRRADFEIEDWLKAAREASITLPPQKRSEWLGLLYNTAAAHDLMALAGGYLEEWVEVNPFIGNLQRLGENLADEKKWPEAAEQFRRAWEKQKQNPVPIYLRSWALRQAGQVAEADNLRTQARLLPLGSPIMRNNLANIMAIKGEHEAAIEEWLMVARLAAEDDYTGNFARERLAAALAQSNPAAAARHQERALLTFLRPEWAHPSLRYYLNVRGKVAQWQALALANEGKPEQALAAVEKFFQNNPGNASIAEVLLPMLGRMGRGDKAKEYYEKTRKLSEQGVELFPKSGMMHNNLAWLHARALRNMDAAMTHAKKAVELNPHTAAYVDTLAEVHFVRGERDKAIELSRKAIALMPDDAELLGQKRRFETEAFPAKPAE